MTRRIPGRLLLATAFGVAFYLVNTLDKTVRDWHQQVAYQERGGTHP